MAEGGAAVPLEVVAAAAAAAAAAMAAAAASVKKDGAGVFLYAAGLLVLAGVHGLLDAWLSAIALVCLFGPGALVFADRGGIGPRGGAPPPGGRRLFGPAAASVAMLGALLFLSFGPQWTIDVPPGRAGLSSVASAGDALVTGLAGALVLGALIVATGLLGALRLMAARRDDGS